MGRWPALLLGIRMLPRGLGALAARFLPREPLQRPEH